MKCQKSAELSEVRKIYTRCRLVYQRCVGDNALPFAATDAVVICAAVIDWKFGGPTLKRYMP
jgi:hypothetical protein